MLIEEKTLHDHDINVRSIRQELLLLEEQLKKHGRNEPQPSPPVTADTDTVSRKAVISAINNLHDKPNAWLDHAVEAVKELPPLPSRPHGQWTKTAISKEAVMYECPLCNRVVVDRINNDPSKTYPFCHCGADMRQQEGGGA